MTTRTANGKRWIQCFVTVLMVQALAAQATRGDDLKRRGLMGIQLAPVSDEVKDRLKLPDAKGVLITGVMPDTAAQEAGLMANDVVVRIGDASIDNLQDLMQSLRKFGAGDTLKVTVIREGNPVSAELTLRPRPREQSTEYETIYDSAGEVGKRVRTILTKPKKEGKQPAILFIQGLAPMSVELAFPQPHPYKSLIGELTNAGFVTMRVERLGVGDSEGEDVQNTTIEDDVSSFRTGLKKLRTYDFVDSGNVFVFSHSSGGAIAPLVADGQGVRGVATFAAFARPWAEHSLDSSLRQWKLEMLKDEEIKTNTERERLFNKELYGKKRSPKEILADHPVLREYADSFMQNDTLIFGVHYKYMQQLASLDLASAWAKTDVPVLAMWGEADYTASRTDSELIASIVNKSHAGKGTFAALPEIDHGYSKAEDQEESFLSGQGSGSFNSIVVDTLVKWMKEQMGSTSS